MKTGFIMVASVALFIGDALAKPPGCPCSPCACGSCSCGGGGRHHDRTRVGAGVNIDLSGLGRRKAEADPFAVPVESSSTSQGGEKRARSASQGEEKKIGKKAKESGPGNLFAGIQLTGRQAKDVTAESTTKAVSKP